MSDKIKRTKDPIFGARCVLHGGSADGVTDYYDLAAYEEYWGAIVICHPCALELVNFMGFVPVAEVEERNEQIKNLYDEAQKVAEENDSLRNAVNVLRSMRTFLDDPILDTSAADSDDEGND